MNVVKERIGQIWDNLLHWTWTKSLLYWMILSAGTASELAFLIASLYVTINSSVHSLVITIIPEATTVHLSQIATAAYVGLPECILPLGIVTTISHVRTWAYGKRDYASATWAILYGLPTLIFLILSIITISCSLLAVNFQLPDWMIVVRGDTGYAYGIIALVFMYVGKPQEVDRLKLKDESITALTISLEDLNTVIEGNDRLIKSQERIIHDQSETLGTLQYDLSNKQQAVEHMTKMLMEKTHLLDSMNETINDSSSHAKTLEQTIFDQEQVIQTIRVESANRANALETLTSRLAEKDEMLNGIHTTIEDSSTHTKTLEQTMNNQSAMIELLREQVANKQNAIEELNRSITEKDELLEEERQECSRLKEELQLAPATGLQAYSEECQKWLASAPKSLSVADISAHTGHTKQKIIGAKLARSTRNPEQILLSALVAWLEKTPPPAPKKEDRSTDKLPVSSGNGHTKETVNLDEYSELLV